MGMLSGTTRGGRRAAVIGSLIVQLGFALACAPGERARAADPLMRDVDAPCPVGETCSALAPRGLHFSSVALTPVPAPPWQTAVGGTQTISFALRSPVSLSASVERGSATAMLVEPAPEDADRRFTFVPAAVGGATVAIRESATRALLDRIELGAVTPEGVELVTGSPVFERSLGLLWLGAAVAIEARGVVGTVGARRQIVDERWSMISLDPDAVRVEGRSLRGLQVGLWGVKTRIGVTAFNPAVRVVDAVDDLRVTGITDREVRPSPWDFRNGVLHVQATLRGVVVDGAPITVDSPPPELLVESRAINALLGQGLFILPAVAVSSPTRVPITLRSGSVVLRGEVLLTP
jgi:hypothetical protein